MVAATFEQLCQHVRQTAMLHSILELLEWDERTKMPAAAGQFRADQVTYLSGEIHRRRTDARLGAWLAELAESDLAADVHSDTGTTIRQLRREYDKLTKIPCQLVEELARASMLGQQTWVEARRHNDFAALAPHLKTIFQLKRQQAAAVGFDDCPYDALLDDYEPAAKTEHVAAVLAALRRELVPLVGEIMASERKANISILQRHYPTAAQEDFGKRAAAAIGFDFERGRLDVTHHPFCCGLGPHDVRLTTRYDERFFPSGFFSILHEAGHGIYDQGVRADQFGLPPGGYVSLGIHESQSRLWENFVGRSLPFWRHFYPAARQSFPVLHDVVLEDFHFAINDVRPSLIRVEADEVTYNLHIIIRFELEQELMNDNLPISDLPAAWNAKYREYLGIEPPHNADGVMQDIHWSAGLIGYFPTYSLGNLNAAQLFAQANQDVGPFEDQFAQGEFQPLLDWLRDQIHRHGQCYTASELIERITQRPLSHEPLVTYLREKYRAVYHR